MVTDSTPLVTEGFGRRYRRNRPWAVQNVSLTMRSGSITALVGPNGAGKSTLIRACLGFERPDAGRILVYGHDPQRERVAAVARIGYVPQSSGLYRGLRITDHLTMAQAARPDFDVEIAAARVAGARLEPGRRVGELSGGEQAQVALAMALGTRAPLLLLDEPLASLDPLARREFLTALVADVRGRAATAVLSSHIVTDVELACDRIVVLGAGRVLLDASISAARDAFRTLPLAEVGARTAIGTFANAQGRQVALVAAGDGGEPATLEDVVLGHLASAQIELVAA